jgi:hypothetical protein
VQWKIYFSPPLAGSVFWIQEVYLGSALGSTESALGDDWKYTAGLTEAWGYGDGLGERKKRIYSYG